MHALRLGIVAGFIANLSYPIAVFANLPMRATAIVAACFGPSLAVACFGLKELLDLERRTISSALGLLLNALSGALFSAMALVQIAAVFLVKDRTVLSSMNAIWLGLDKAFDSYLGLGTIFFSIAMWRHPRFGRAMAVAGIAIATGLLALNFYTFPAPPANAGLFDPGPVIGFWYLIVTILMVSSWSWAKQRTSQLATKQLL
jgi:hypothetical protein